MDNKKLMQILLRDVAELEEIVSGIRHSGSWEPLEMELLSTRISGVRHMLEVVSSGEVGIVSDRAREKTQLSQVEEILPAAGQKLRTEIVNLQPVEKLPSSEPELAPPVVIQEKSMPVEMPVPVVENSTLSKQSAVLEEEQDEMELEEEAVAGPQTLGEKFSQGRSVNDLLLEHGKSDYKFTNMPVTSLHAAIGINDRFLFTRELFDGNGDAFAKAVKEIDAMSNIHDAATYLREHFKWKKNETSLKFIDLVKRRFGNR